MGAAKDLKFFLPRKLLASPAYHCLNLYVRTIRLQVDHAEPVLHHLNGGKRIVFAGRHERFFSGFHFPRLFRFKPCIMISRNRDGDFVAQVAGRLGWRPIRGSSSRGGKEALQEMTRGVVEQAVGGHVVDGPRGPARRVKPGLISLAIRAEAVICPVYLSYENPWIFSSWDRFMIPKPFARGRILIGRFIPLKGDMTEEEFEDLRRKIENEMVEGHSTLDGSWQKAIK